MTDTKMCIKCKKVLPTSMFYEIPYFHTCKKCSNLKSKEWRARNPERVTANYMRWKAKNKDYLKEYKHNHQKLYQPVLNARRKEDDVFAEKERTRARHNFHKHSFEYFLFRQLKNTILTVNDLPCDLMLLLRETWKTRRLLYKLHKEQAQGGTANV